MTGYAGKLLAQKIIITLKIFKFTNSLNKGKINFILV